MIESPIPLKKNLQAGLTTLPLSGRHLIEASAGTGKTYNITKLYLRLLLEKRLRVQEILVMTFTKAATEELRGRIEKAVRELSEQWLNPGNDSFVLALKQTLSEEEGRLLLKRALLEMDEAAIFTIHAFCNRVLTQEAFASGLPMDLSMETDTSQLLLEAVRDWFRKLAQNEAQYLILLERGWGTPERFLKSFDKLIESDPERILFEVDPEFEGETVPFATAMAAKEELLNQLPDVEPQVGPHFIHKKTGEEAEQRAQAWQHIQAWLHQEECSLSPPFGKMFLNRNLVSKSNPLRPFVDAVHQFNELYQRSVKAWALMSIKQAVEVIQALFYEAKRQTQQMDFNDLVQIMADRLAEDPEGQLVKLLRRQYPVALVDEFQDTDDTQFSIFNHLYPKDQDTHALFMIGDPKQAIYSFRGGDIYAYLAAREQANHQWFMDTNWRSLQNVVEGYNRLFYGKPRDDSPTDLVFRNGISYDWIHFSPKAEAANSPLFDPESDRRGISFFWLPEVMNPTGVNKPKKEDWVLGLTRWCVHEIHRLLHEAEFEDRETGTRRKVQERDIAILVRTSSEADMIQRALRKAGYPCVYLSDRTQVFSSVESRELEWVLDGILNNEDDRLLTRAIATRLFGADARLLAHFGELLPEEAAEPGVHENLLLSLGSEDAWEAMKARAVDLREIWRTQGCLAMLLNLMHESFHPDPDQHERSLTNYLHVFELLQQASRRFRQPLQLLKWYQDQRANPAKQADAEQRLESDANLIRIVTQHSSKGLEYPLVFVPYSCVYKDPTKVGNMNKDYFKFHDPDTHEMRVQVGQSEAAIRLSKEEGHDESVRLFYVAVTRASHRCYVGLAPLADSHKSGVGRVLGVNESTAGAWSPVLHEVATTSGGNCGVIQITSETPSPARGLSEVLAHPKLQPACLNHAIDEGWQLASYSLLSRRAHSLEKQDKKDRDEMAMDSASGKTSGNGGESSAAIPLALRFRMDKGAKTGDLLHDMLEHIHFDQPRWEAVLPPLIEGEDVRNSERAELQGWMEEVLCTPIPVIGDSATSFSLGQLEAESVLKEAEFYFTVTAVHPTRLGALVERHRGGVGSSVRLQGEVIKGMMHGFIDLIFEWQGRYYLADYKSSWLGNRLEDYEANALEVNIRHSLYDLQYLIYSLALHRYLKHRLGSDYRPSDHFGGVYYLYLRGMHPANASPLGIYAKAIGERELNALDALFSDAPGKVTGAAHHQVQGE